MAKAGQSISNPLTGQRVVFVTTAAETGGTSLDLEWFVEPFRGKYPPEHVHLNQNERFEIISGQARYQLGGVERAAGPGDVLDFPVNVPHIHPWSTSADGLHLRHHVACLTPDLHGLQAIEKLGETSYGLARDGKGGRDGTGNLFQAAVLGAEMLPGVHPTRPPLIVQRIGVGILAPIGRLLGYRVQYPQYIDQSG